MYCNIYAQYCAYLVYKRPDWAMQWILVKLDIDMHYCVVFCSTPSLPKYCTIFQCPPEKYIYFHCYHPNIQKLMANGLFKLYHEYKSWNENYHSFYGKMSIICTFPQQIIVTYMIFLSSSHSCLKTERNFCSLGNCSFILKAAPRLQLCFLLSPRIIQSTSMKHVQDCSFCHCGQLAWMRLSIQIISFTLQNRVPVSKLYPQNDTTSIQTDKPQPRILWHGTKLCLRLS